MSRRRTNRKRLAARNARRAAQILNHTTGSNRPWQPIGSASIGGTKGIAYIQLKETE